MAGTIVPYLAGGSAAAYARELRALEQDAQRRDRRRPAWVGWLGVVMASAGLLAGLAAALPLLPDHDGPDTPVAVAATPTSVTILAGPQAVQASMGSPAHASTATHKAAHRPAG